MEEPQVVRPNPTRMEDLPWHPRILAEWEEEKRQQGVPQLSTAQRRANQAGQPRETDGKYAEKPGSKWQQHLTGSPASTSGKARKPTRTRSSQGKRTQRLPSKLSMLDKPPHQKVVWLVRKWFRRKQKHLRALFSLRG